MVKDKSRSLSTIYFADHIPSISLYIYDYTNVNQALAFYDKIQFNSLLIDLTQSSAQIMGDYNYNNRRYCKIAEKENLQFKSIKSAEHLYHLQKSQVEAISDLKYYPHSLLTESPHRIFTAVAYGDKTLCFHGYLIDKEKGIALLNINVSTFREYSDPKERQRVGIANAALFNHDLLYFKELSFDTYDFGGIEIDSLKKFKKGFGGYEKSYFRYTPKILKLRKLIGI